MMRGFSSTIAGPGAWLGGLDHGGSSVDAQLGGRDAHALGEGVNPADRVERGEQAVDSCLRLRALGGQVEGAGGQVQDLGAVLDHSEVAHLLAGLHLDHLAPHVTVRLRNLHSRR